VFSDQFVPMLMNDALKQLRKAAMNEKDLEKEEVKTMIAMTTPKNKIEGKRRGRQKKSEGEEEHEKYMEEEEEMYKREDRSKSKEKGSSSDEDNDEEVGDQDFNVELDGVQKHSMSKSYEQDEEEEEDHEMKKDEEEEEDEKYQQMCSLYKEHLSKYQGYIKKVDYEKD